VSWHGFDLVAAVTANCGVTSALIAITG
jgi:hypothetical protein